MYSLESCCSVCPLHITSQRIALRPLALTPPQAFFRESRKSEQEIGNEREAQMRGNRSFLSFHKYI